MSDKLAMIQDWYQRVWIEGDMSAVYEYFAPDVAAAGLFPDVAMRPNEFEELATALMQHLQVDAFSIDQSIEQGDWMACMITFRFTVLATGKENTVTGMVMVRVIDGRIVQAYNSLDFITVFERLDILPPNSMALCLAGQPLA